MTTNIKAFDGFLELEHEDLPALRTRKEVCSRCRGEGILHGFPGTYTQDDFDDAVDLDEYLRHVRTCEDCDGLRVITVVDREASHPDTLGQWDEWCREISAMRHIEAQERRYGA